MQWDEKELDTQFTPNVYFWTPNSEVLAKALSYMYTYSFLSDWGHEWAFIRANNHPLKKEYML